MKRIKGYISENKYYKKVIKQEKADNGKRINIKTILKKIGIFLETFFIFNILNIIQLILVKNLKIKLLLNSSRYIKEIGWKNFLKLISNLDFFNMTYFLNLLLIFAVFLLVLAITRRKRASVISTLSFVYLYSIANYLITEIRGSALTLYDILSIGTGINVAGNIKITIDKNIVIATVLYIFTLILSIVIYRKCKKSNIVERLVSVSISIVIITIISNSSIVKRISIWDMEKAYTRNGVPLILLKLASNLKIEKPEDYKREEVISLLNQYKYIDNTEYELDTNIIVIMNESFTDYTEISQLNVLSDNIPYFHSLQNEENVITGIMHSDTFGGGTANIEYEFLTQNTIAFMPKGVLPYQQYISKETPSLISKLNEIGYKTYGIHLWKKGGYNRETVYKLLGFNTYKFIEDYEDIEYTTNEFPTDKCSYSKIKEILEYKNKGEKSFIFNLTMQNHLPYIHSDEKQPNYANEEELNIYLQMQNYSDSALKDLIQYLEEYDERVILLFFGDHQPNVGLDNINDNNNIKWSVPYLIWTNYEIQKKEYGDTSAIYLQSMLLDVANLPKDEYTNYIIELRKKIPILTANYYIGDNGKRYEITDETSPYYSKIKEYENIVYYQVLDR